MKYTFARKAALKYTFAYTSRDKEYAICYNESRTKRSRDFIAVQSGDCIGDCIGQLNDKQKGLDSWQIIRLTMQVVMAGLFMNPNTLIRIMQKTCMWSKVR